MRLAGLAALALALPATALAAGEAVPAVSAWPMLGALAAVVAAVFAVAFVLRRLGVRPGGPAAGILRPVASLALGARERLVVVQVDDRWLVLGVTAQSIRPLADLAARDLPPPPEPGPAFATLLAGALGRREKR
jgi:flagellar protein FliO/FliZ